MFAGANTSMLLKPHSCGTSWRDKKFPAGGTQPMSGQGYRKTAETRFLCPVSAVFLCKALVLGVPSTFAACGRHLLQQEKAFLGFRPGLYVQRSIFISEPRWLPAAEAFRGEKPGGPLSHGVPPCQLSHRESQGGWVRIRLDVLRIGSACRPSSVRASPCQLP